MKTSSRTCRPTSSCAARSPSTRKRHLSIAGRLAGLLTLPDQYSSWLPGGAAAGTALIRRHKRRVIWSTYPVPTAQLLGYLLHRLSRLPRVADLRDPMIDDYYPAEPANRRWHATIERRINHLPTTAVRRDRLRQEHR